MILSEFTPDVKKSILDSPVLLNNLANLVSTDIPGMMRMINSNSQKLHHYMILKEISEHLKIKIDKLINPIL